MQALSTFHASIKWAKFHFTPFFYNNTPKYKSSKSESIYKKRKESLQSINFKEIFILWSNLIETLERKTRV